MNSRASSVRHFKAERPPDWLDRPWENEQQVRMRLRPLEINVSVNYARLSINSVRLEKRCRGRGTAAHLRDFNPVYVGYGVKTSKAQNEQMFSGMAPKAHKTDVSALPMGPSACLRN
jgi:hypothetical protein